MWVVRQSLRQKVPVLQREHGNKSVVPACAKSVCLFDASFYLGKWESHPLTPRCVFPKELKYA